MMGKDVDMENHINLMVQYTKVIGIVNMMDKERLYIRLGVDIKEVFNMDKNMVKE